MRRGIVGAPGPRKTGRIHLACQASEKRKPGEFSLMDSLGQAERIADRRSSKARASGSGSERGRYDGSMLGKHLSVVSACLLLACDGTEPADDGASTTSG